MSLELKINDDIKAAMLARNQEKLEALRAIKAALLLEKTKESSTGVIDEAVWMNPGDMVESMAWPEVIAVETSNFAGNTINDNDLPAPQLSLSVTTPRNLLLSWPVSPVVPYLLEQNNSLSTTNWVLVTNLTTVVGGQNQVVLPLAQTTNSFFRLSASPGF